MSTVNLDSYRAALEAKRREITSGRFDRGEILIEKTADEFDRMQLQLNREVAISHLDRESKLLKDVQAAIARIANGTFGMCLQCEECLPEKRLKALPWAAYCVPCQEWIERQRAAGQLGDVSDTDELAA